MKPDSLKETALEALRCVLTENGIKKTPRRGNAAFSVVERCVWLWKGCVLSSQEKDDQKSILRAIAHWNKRRKKRERSHVVSETQLEQFKAELSAKMQEVINFQLGNEEGSGEEKDAENGEHVPVQRRGRPRSAPKEIALEALWRFVRRNSLMHRPKQSDPSFKIVIECVNYWKGGCWWLEHSEDNRRRLLKEISKWFTRRRKQESSHPLARCKELQVLETKLSQIFETLSAPTRNLKRKRPTTSHKHCDDTHSAHLHRFNAGKRRVLHFVDKDKAPHIDLIDANGVKHCPETLQAVSEGIADHIHGPDCGHQAVLHMLPWEEVPHVDFVGSQGSIYCDHTASLLCKNAGCEGSCLEKEQIRIFQDLNSGELLEALDSICVESLVKLNN